MKKLLLLITVSLLAFGCSSDDDDGKNYTDTIYYQSIIDFQNGLLDPVEGFVLNGTITNKDTGEVKNGSLEIVYIGEINEGWKDRQFNIVYRIEEEILDTDEIKLSRTDEYKLDVALRLHKTKYRPSLILVNYGLSFRLLPVLNGSSFDRFYWEETTIR